MAADSEAREPASEVKFLIDSDTADAVRTWARHHVGADPFANSETSSYATNSLYFDTEDLDVLRENGSYARSKYRVRRYGDGPAIFLERKMRKHGVVTKRRSIIGLEQLNRLDNLQTERGWKGFWFHRRILARELRPVCQVSYRRFARVTETNTELLRLTIDSHLFVRQTGAMAFGEMENSLELSENRRILELKFRREMPLLFQKFVTDFGLVPATVSKYRLAAAALGFSASQAREAA